MKQSLKILFGFWVTASHFYVYFILRLFFHAGSLPPLNGCYRPDLVLPPEQCHVQYEGKYSSLLQFSFYILLNTEFSYLKSATALRGRNYLRDIELYL
jgi:hypothetical protein